MIIYLLWGQRNESYNGQFAPELLYSIDEYTYDENPTFFDDNYNVLLNDIGMNYNDFEDIQVATIEINDDELYSIFDIKKLNAKLIKNEDKK